jgi:hypothetical protein
VIADDLDVSLPVPESETGPGGRTCIRSFN